MHIVFQLWLTGRGSNFFFFVLRENERRKSFLAPKRRRKREFFPPFTALDRWNRKRKEQRLVFFPPSLPPAAAAKKRVKVKQTPLLHFCHTFYLRVTRNTLSLSFPSTQKSPQGVFFYFIRSINEALPLPTKKISFSERKIKTLLLPSNYLLLKPGDADFCIFWPFSSPAIIFAPPSESRLPVYFF